MQAQSLPPNPPLFSDCGSRPSDGMAVSPPSAAPFCLGHDAKAGGGWFSTAPALGDGECGLEVTKKITPPKSGGVIRE